MRKAQGISINTIIIAAIALIVLVVIIAIFTGRLGIWGQGLDKASNQKCEGEDNGYTREPALSQDCDITKTILGKFDNVPSGYVCCRVEHG